VPVIVGIVAVRNLSRVAEWKLFYILPLETLVNIVPVVFFCVTILNFALIGGIFPVVVQCIVITLSA
jgi:hypothetical protein